MATEYGLEVLVTPIVDSAAAAAMGAKTAQSFNQGFERSLSKQPLGRITGQASEFQKSIEASNARVIAFGASAGSIYLVKVALDKLIGSTVQVEKGLANINVILGLGQTALRGFSNEMFKAASQTGQTFETASKVALEFARHGVSATETVKRMTSAMELMRISGLSAEDSVNSITAAINAFNKEGLTSEDVVNRLTAVDTKFAVSAQDLAESIRRVGATAEDAGVRFNELLGFVTAAQTVTARGGAVIGNAFKSIFTRLARPQVLDDLEAVGVATRTTSGQILPMVTILKGLASTYDSLSYSQKSFITQAVGGVYQVNILKASLADLGNGMSIFDKASLAASQSAGLIDKRMSALNETLASKVNSSMLEITKLFSNFGNIAFGDSAKSGVDALNKELAFLSDKLEDIKPDDSVGEKMGKTLGQGISRGIGDILSGPVVQMVAALGTKAMITLGSFAQKSGKEFLGKNSDAEKLAYIQKDITKFIKENKDAQALFNSELDKSVELSKLYLQTLSKSRIFDEKSKNVSRWVANIVQGSMSATPITRASGYVPSFAAHQEVSQARALGAPASVQAQWGRGTIGGQSFVMNNKEMEIPHFGTNGDSAVLPMYAKGHIPNFAHIPLLSPLVGRFLTNTVTPGGYYVNDKVGEVSHLSLKDITNALILDKPTRNVQAKINSTSTGKVRDFAFRKMFGLSSRTDVSRLISENQDKTYSFNRGTSFRSSIAEDALTGDYSYGHDVMGGYDAAPNSSGGISYKDKWDIGLHPYEKISYKNLFSKDSWGLNNPQGVVSRMLRKLIHPITSPITFAGDISKGEINDARILAENPPQMYGRYFGGFVPNFANLNFESSQGKFGLTQIRGYLGKQRVGDLEYSEDDEKAKEIEYFGIDKKHQGQGYAKQFYQAMGPGKAHGIILPNFDKQGNVFFPQLSRAAVAKDASIVYHGALGKTQGDPWWKSSRKTFSIDEFKQLIAQHQQDKSFWNDNGNSFELITNHAKGFIPNFANIDLYRGVGGSRFHKTLPHAGFGDKMSEEEINDIIFSKRSISKTSLTHQKAAFYNNNVFGGGEKLHLNYLQAYLNYHLNAGGGTGLLSTSLSEKVARSFSGSPMGLGKISIPEARILTYENLTNLLERLGPTKLSKVLMNSTSEANAEKGRKHKFFGFELNSILDGLGSGANYAEEKEVALMNKGFVPNFALDKVFSVIVKANSIRNHGLQSEIGGDYEMEALKRLPSLGFSNIHWFSRPGGGNNNSNADFYARYAGFPWLLDAKYSKSLSDKALQPKGLSYKEGMMRRQWAKMQANQSYMSFDPDLAKDIHLMKFGIISSNFISSPRARTYKKIGVPWENLARGFIPNFGLGDDRFNQMGQFLMRGVKKPLPTLSKNDYADYTSYLGGVSAAQLDKDMKDGYFGGAFDIGRKKTSSLHRLLKKKGFSFSALQNAIGREVSAGYSPEQVLIGESSSLVSSHNPSGVGVYNSTEGSLDRGISLAQQAGVDPSTKGMAGGYVPNFAGVESSWLMGMIQGSVTDLSKRLNFLSVGYDKEIEARRKLAEEYSKAVSQVKAGQSAITPLGTFTDEKNLKQAYYSKYRDPTPENPRGGKYLFQKRESERETKRYDQYYQEKQASQKKLSDLGFKGMFAGPMIGEGIASVFKTAGMENVSKGFQEFSGGITMASQMLNLFPDKLGKALAVGEMVKSFGNAIAAATSKVGTYEKQLDIQSTILEKLGSASSVMLDSYDKLNQIYNSSTSTMQDFLVQQQRLAKSLIELAGVTGGGQLIHDLRGASTSQQRQMAVTKAMEEAQSLKNIDSVKLEIAQSKQSSWGTASAFSYANDADKINKTQLLRTASYTMHGSALDNLKDKDLNQRLITGSINDQDISRIMSKAADQNKDVLGLNTNDLKQALKELKWNLDQIKMPTKYEGGMEAWTKHLQELFQSTQEEISLRNKYNQELQSALAQGAIISSYNLKQGTQGVESRYREQSLGLARGAEQVRLKGLTTNDYGMINIEAAQKREEIKAKTQYEQKLNVNKGDIEVNTMMSGVIGKALERLKTPNPEGVVNNISVAQQEMSNFLNPKLQNLSRPENAGQLFKMAQNPDTFADKVLGNKTEAITQNSFNQLKTELTTMGRSPDLLAKIADILDKQLNLTSDGKKALDELDVHTQAALKEMNFKDLSNALGGQDILKRGHAREMRRRIVKDEYIMNHSTNAIARGGAAADEASLILPEDRKGPLWDKIKKNMQQGLMSADTFALRGTELGQTQSFQNTQAVAFAQNYGNNKGVGGAPQGPENVSLAPGVSELDEAADKAAIDVSAFGKALASLGNLDTLKAFAAQLEAIQKRIDTLNPPPAPGTSPKEPVVPPQNFWQRHLPSMTDVTSAVVTGAAMGAVGPIAGKLGGVGKRLLRGAKKKVSEMHLPVRGGAGTPSQSELNFENSPIAEWSKGKGNNFSYEAMNGAGKTFKGTLKATSQNDVINMLRDKGLFPTKVLEIEPGPGPKLEIPKPQNTQTGLSPEEEAKYLKDRAKNNRTTPLSKERMKLEIEPGPGPKLEIPKPQNTQTGLSPEEEAKYLKDRAKNNNFGDIPTTKPSTASPFDREIQLNSRLNKAREAFSKGMMRSTGTEYDAGGPKVQQMQRIRERADRLLARTQPQAEPLPLEGDLSWVKEPKLEIPKSPNIKPSSTPIIEREPLPIMAPGEDPKSLDILSKLEPTKAPESLLSKITFSKQWNQLEEEMKMFKPLSKVMDTVGKFVAPVAKILKPIAPALKLVGKLAGPLAIGLGAAETAQDIKNKDYMQAALHGSQTAAGFAGPYGLAWNVGTTIGTGLGEGIVESNEAWDNWREKPDLQRLSKSEDLYSHTLKQSGAMEPYLREMNAIDSRISFSETLKQQFASGKRPQTEKYNESSMDQYIAVEKVKKAAILDTLHKQYNTPKVDENGQPLASTSTATTGKSTENQQQNVNVKVNDFIGKFTVDFKKGWEEIIVLVKSTVNEAIDTREGKRPPTVETH